MFAAIAAAFAALPLVIQIIITIAAVGLPSLTYYKMVIVPGQEVAGAAAELATKAAGVGGQIIDAHGKVIKGATKAGEAVVKAATKKCRPEFEKVGLDCLPKCPHGTSGLYCKKKEYKLGTYKVSKAKHACKTGYTKLKFPFNKTCKETSCKPGYKRLKFPKVDTCQFQPECPKYTKKDFTGGCKRKPERHWF